MSRKRRVELYHISLEKTGYFRIKLPTGWRRLHTWLGEKIIGRPLRKGEVVHHKNGDPGDNRRENLQVMTQTEHIRLHKPTEGYEAKVEKCRRMRLRRKLI